MEERGFVGLRDFAADSRLIRALRLCMGSLVILRFPLLLAKS